MSIRRVAGNEEVKLVLAARVVVDGGRRSAAVSGAGRTGLSGRTTFGDGPAEEVAPGRKHALP